ncbi:AI-2E family transporter [Echinicola strongylocentroti]|uniref:AI-2E family transporter n=1 Tax=Echinicola strongylocentroti TaxID=1795355 RepID=A0A2Z4IMS6_9BACT|nr:AI-2E family transporter [Echinicola strongylocentroti]AWW32037.1 AI-2E family transporter [Echinicola strongylocentroti]
MENRNRFPHPLFYLFPLYAIGLYFLVLGVINAYVFLAPISIAALMTMILLPVVRKFENWKINRFLSTFLATCLALSLYLSMFVVISLQANSIYENWDTVSGRVQNTVQKVQESISGISGVSPDKQLEILNIPPSALSSDSTNAVNSQKSEKDSTSKKGETKESTAKQNSGVKAAITNFLDFVGYSLLTFIYIFFFLFYRTKIRLSIVRFFPENQRDKTNKILNGSLSIAKQYLVGRLILIFFLWIIYSVGMAVSGIDSPILISLIAAALSLIPYVGTVIGYVIAMMMAVVSGGETGQYIGVSITYGLAQFVETYILEPFVVGDKVDLNPLVTIIVVVLGGLVWGVVGMVISIPLFGMLKILADQVTVLKPLGYFLGQDDMGSKDDDFLGAIAKKLKRMFK